MKIAGLIIKYLILLFMLFNTGVVLVIIFHISESNSYLIIIFLTYILYQLRGENK